MQSKNDDELSYSNAKIMCDPVSVTYTLGPLAANKTFLIMTLFDIGTLSIFKIGGTDVQVSPILKNESVLMSDFSKEEKNIKITFWNSSELVRVAPILKNESVPPEKQRHNIIIEFRVLILKLPAVNNYRLP
jgi:hypothetical protein